MGDYVSVSSSIVTNVLLLGDVASGRGYACVGVGGRWEVSLFWSSFFHEHKTIKKKKRNLRTVLQRGVRKDFRQRHH